MVRFINRFTNTEMWVTDERKDEYMAAGHILVANAQSAKPTVEVKPVEKKVTPKKTTTTAKKTTAKKK